MGTRYQGQHPPEGDIQVLMRSQKGENRSFPMMAHNACEQVTSAETILTKKEGLTEVPAQPSFAASAMCRQATPAPDLRVPTARGSAPTTPKPIPPRPTSREGNDLL